MINGETGRGGGGETGREEGGDSHTYLHLPLDILVHDKYVYSTLAVEI